MTNPQIFDQEGRRISSEAGRMHPDIKQRWVTALMEQDPDTQMIGSLALCREWSGGRQWNALGVLCRVMGIPETIVPGPDHTASVLFDGASHYLTPRVLSLARLVPRGPHVGRIYIDNTLHHQAYTIQHLSASGCTFKTLAKIVDFQL